MRFVRSLPVRPDRRLHARTPTHRRVRLILEPTMNLYQRIKRILPLCEPATATSIAVELDADPEATRGALEQLVRRGKAKHDGHTDPALRQWWTA